MISFILSLIIKLLNFLISFILTIIFSFIPTFDFSSFSEIYQNFFNILGRGGNLVFFLVGFPLFIYTDILIALFAWKHIVLPVINFTRKIALK